MLVFPESLPQMVEQIQHVQEATDSLAEYIPML